MPQQGGLAALIAHPNTIRKQSVLPGQTAIKLPVFNEPRVKTQVRRTQKLPKNAINDLASFIAAWALKSSWRIKLEMCSQAVQAFIIAHFYVPEATSTTSNARFHNFFHDLLQLAPELSEHEVAGADDFEDNLDDKLESFCQSYGVNENARRRLTLLDDKTLSIVLDQFVPELGEDENIRILSFANSVEKRNSAAKTAVNDELAKRLDDFCIQYELNDSVRNRLENLAPQHLEYVMDHFQLPQGMTECNGLVIKYANSIHNKVDVGKLTQKPNNETRTNNQRTPLDSFCEVYNLNPQVRQVLDTLSASSLETVMENFKKPAGSTDVNGLVVSFATSVAKKQALEAATRKHSARQGVETYQSNQTAHFNIRTAQHVPQAAFQGAVKRAFPSVPTNRSDPQDDAFNDFCVRFNINEDARGKLERMSSTVRNKVVQKFKLQHNTAECNGLVINFARSVEKHEATKFGPEVCHTPHTVALVDQFCQTYNLNDDSRRKLLSLNEQDQETVMQEFVCPQGVTECNGMLINFANSVEKKQIKGAFDNAAPSVSAPVEQFCVDYQLNLDAQRKLLSLTEEQRRALINDFVCPPNATDVNGLVIRYAQSIEQRWRTQAALQDGNSELADFVARYHLNEDAQGVLSSLDPRTLEHVVHNFVCPQGATECNGALISYARSVQNNINNGIGMKKMRLNSH